MKKLCCPHNFSSYFSFSGCLLVSGAKINKRRGDKANNEHTSTNLFIPIPP